MEMIMCINRVGSLGIKGKLPWKCSQDLKHFKKLTHKKRCLVGRKTFESLPPLPNRELLVVGKGYLTLEQAMEREPEMVIGGKTLFKKFINDVTKIHLSIVVDDNTIGDVGFNGSEIWKIITSMRTKIYKFRKD